MPFLLGAGDLLTAVHADEVQLLRCNAAQAAEQQRRRAADGGEGDQRHQYVERADPDGDSGEHCGRAGGIGRHAQRVAADATVQRTHKRGLPTGHGTKRYPRGHAHAAQQGDFTATAATPGAGSGAAAPQGGHRGHSESTAAAVSAREPARFVARLCRLGILAPGLAFLLAHHAAMDADSIRVKSASNRRVCPRRPLCVLDLDGRDRRSISVIRFTHQVYPAAES